MWWSFRKCWPRLFRIGGPRPAGIEPPSCEGVMAGLATQEDDGEIVAARRAVGMRVDHLCDFAQNLRRGQVTTSAYRLENALLAESLTGAVSRVTHPVGKEHEEV